MRPGPWDEIVIHRQDKILLQAYLRSDTPQGAAEYLAGRCAHLELAQQPKPAVEIVHYDLPPRSLPSEAVLLVQIVGSLIGVCALWVLADALLRRLGGL